MSKAKTQAALVLALCLFVAWYSARLDPATLEAQGHFGFLALLPAIATLAICFMTRNVILALFMGVVLGGLITTRYNIIQEFLIPSIGSARYAQILLVYLWALAGCSACGIEMAVPGISPSTCLITSLSPAALPCFSPGSWA